MEITDYVKTQVRGDRAELKRRLDQFAGDIVAAAMAYDPDGPWTEEEDRILDAVCGCHQIVNLVDRIAILEEVANAG